MTEVRSDFGCRAVNAATAEYFEAEDALGRWLAEGCVQGANLTATSAVLFAAWKSWAEANGEFVGSLKRFSENLAARGFEKCRDPRTDRQGFRGLAPRETTTTTEGMEFPPA